VRSIRLSRECRRLSTEEFEWDLGVWCRWVLPGLGFLLRGLVGEKAFEGFDQIENGKGNEI